jgi:AraC family transcriptional regulator
MSGPAGAERAHDPVARTILVALETALTHRVEPVVSESLASALSARLVGAVASVPRPDGGRSVVPDGPPLRRLPPAALARVVGYMRARLDQPVTLDDLAREANLSKFHFLRLFAATVGTTPHRYLTELRMVRGAEMLRSGDHTVAVVASRCGYATPSRFSAAFREHFGTSPGRYRHALTGS